MDSYFSLNFFRENFFLIFHEDYSALEVEV